MADNETITDIIAEKRRRADELEASSYRPHQFLRERIAELRQEAARIEVALRRERGDCAKLREALDESRRIASDLGGCRLNDYWKLNEIVRVCDAALAAPPRNCDRFANVDEARKAHEEYRGDYIMRASNKFDFPMEFEAWLFAPATEKEGGAK